MNYMPSSRSGEGAAVAPTVLSADTVIPRAAPVADSLLAGLQLGPRRAGYGLPCAKCRTYYAADLPVCPLCKTEERVLPVADMAPLASSPLPESTAIPALDDDALEQERERFLREYAAHVKADPAAGFHCSLDENHEGGEIQSAAVCQDCYVRLQERVDLLEAALHMDLREATQLIYDAVWSDPSDPSKTYQNAAQAVLAELHRRAGISAVLGRHQSLAH
jgi:hypothetical protein